jgi:GT2 family glycosyltransferase
MTEEKTFHIPIEAANFSRSRVDIIIPFHGEYSRVSALVESIWMLTRSNPYQICLVDDASPNKDFIQIFKDRPQIFTIRNETQKGFAGALQTGYEATLQPWVLFLHSDCLVQHRNWMFELGKALLELKNQGVRMVSARSDKPGDFTDDRLKSKPGEVFPHIILEKEDSYLPLYCVMCHRDLFNHIGGFIKNYPYGGYEDTELGYRMRKYGYKQAICGKSWVHHYGGVTLESICHKNYSAKKEMEKNRDRCLADLKRIGVVHSS